MNRCWLWVVPMLLLLGGDGLAMERPKWSFELKGGTFHSDLDEWGTFYDDDRMAHYGVAVAYKLLRPLEIGIEAGYRNDRGQGFAPAHGIVAGNVRYQLLPVHITATLRGIFYEDQWLVPYIGAAAGRYSYRIDIEGQDRVSGGTGGTYVRAGLQLLLDRFDPSAAIGMRRHFGIDNTYLFFEARESEAEVDGSELGGTAYLGGLLFEF
jgi:hypothetical protein